MIDERKKRRQPVTSYLKIRCGDSHGDPGRVVDISTDGMRICSVEPIQTDKTSTFRLALPAAKGKEEIVFNADVIWCRRAKNPELYNTGIRLRDLTPQNIELIEEFLELSSREDRWLSVIKNI